MIKSQKKATNLGSSINSRLEVFLDVKRHLWPQMLAVLDLVKVELRRKLTTKAPVKVNPANLSWGRQRLLNPKEINLFKLEVRPVLASLEVVGGQLPSRKMITRPLLDLPKVIWT